MIQQQRLKRFLGCTLVLICQGCADIATIGNNDQIAEYAEAVFRKQNAITSRIMMSGGENENEDVKLRQAELAMYDACKLLNEYSSKEMDGETIGVLFKRKVRASIKGCDDSIHQVEIILNGDQ